MWKNFKELIKKLLHLETNERKNFALWMMFGAAVVFTILATIGLFMVANSHGLVFWLSVIAHVQIFSILAGFIAQLVKRRISISKNGGINITDLDEMLKYLPRENTYPEGNYTPGPMYPEGNYTPGSMYPEGNYTPGPMYQEGQYIPEESQRGNRASFNLDLEFGNGNKQSGHNNE